MNMNKIEKIEYAEYDKVINIDLFNKIISFIISTKSSKSTWDILREVENKCIWINKTESYAIQEEYKFQYFGELLERYEERIGNDIKDVRAIALALGYASKLIENNMIIGTQLVDFISKIKNLVEDDIYLKGALYLYDNEKFYMYAEELMNKRYTNTEEIVFALSILNERIDDFFKQNKKQIIDLIGKAKSISVMGNIGIYAWLIKNLYPLIHKDRKKDISLLKALIKVPTGLQKEDSLVYKELINNGYNKEEIMYLNYVILYYNTVPNSVRVENSILEEKIATNLCITLINSEKTYEKNIYDLLRSILSKHKEFRIKCYGCCGIKEAIEYKINIINPITFTELFDELDKDLYSFNILEKKWDVVATQVNSEKYQEIFDLFLLCNVFNKEKINECINKYNELTHKNYIESFFEYDYKRESNFRLLVEQNVILLRKIFEHIIKDNKKSRDNHLKKYIKGISNKKSFEFLKYLLRLNKYNIKEINHFGFDFENLVYCYRSFGKMRCDIHLKKEFLNIKEHKILFNCIENFIFYNKPVVYFGFLEEVLKNNMIRKLFKKEELRQIYLALCEIAPETYKYEWLQEKYLSSEEMNSIREQKRIEKEQKEKEKLLQEEKIAIEEFEKVNEKNSFESLFKFCKDYHYNEIKLKFYINITKKYIMDNLSRFERNIKETMYLMKILDFFIEKNKISQIETTKIIYEYVKEEVLKNECFNKAC